MKDSNFQHKNENNRHDEEKNGIAPVTVTTLANKQTNRNDKH